MSQHNFICTAIVDSGDILVTLIQDLLANISWILDKAPEVKFTWWLSVTKTTRNKIISYMPYGSECMAKTMGGRVHFRAELPQRVNRQQTEVVQEYAGIVPP